MPVPKSAAALRTPVCELFGIEYPIVQTGMGWVSGASLTAATSAAGGLGILAAATMTVSELEAAIVKVKSRTGKPFGVNLLPATADLDARVKLLQAESVPVVSFAGPPSAATIGVLKDAGVTTIVTVGARRHAEKMAERGADALIAQGGEGGGHTGSVPTTLLSPQVCDAVEIPVLGAGGFFDGRGLVAALAYGADGVAMGTRFLLSAESHVPGNVKDRYLATDVFGTVVSASIDGAPQRVIRTDMIDKLEGSIGLSRFPRAARNALKFRKLTGTTLRELVKTGREMKREQDLTWSQLALAANAPMLTKAAMVDGHPEVGILPTGQVVGVIDELPSVAELLDSIMTEAEAVLERLTTSG